MITANGIPVRSTVLPDEKLSEHEWIIRFRVGSYAAEYRRLIEQEKPKNYKIVPSNICNFGLLSNLLREKGII